MNKYNNSYQKFCFNCTSFSFSLFVNSLWIEKYCSSMVYQWCTYYCHHELNMVI